MASRCNFSLQYHLWIKHLSYENKGNDHKLKQLLIIKQILLVTFLRNILENSMENMHTDVDV